MDNISVVLAPWSHQVDWIRAPAWTVLREERENKEIKDKMNTRAATFWYFLIFICWCFAYVWVFIYIYLDLDIYIYLDASNLPLNNHTNWAYWDNCIPSLSDKQSQPKPHPSLNYLIALCCKAGVYCLQFRPPSPIPKHNWL